MVKAEINSRAFYDDAAVESLLRISPNSISRSCNRGELKFVNRAGRRFFRGAWLIAWLDADSVDQREEASRA